MDIWDKFYKIYSPLRSEYNFFMHSHRGLKDGAWIKIYQNDKLIIKRSCDETEDEDIEALVQGTISELKYWEKRQKERA